MLLSPGDGAHATRGLGAESESVAAEVVSMMAGGEAAALGAVLRRARGRATRSLMAQAVELDEARIERLESGASEPTPAELDAYARTFGMWRFFEGFDRVEQRANAFAAHFLAPAEGVRETVGSGNPTSEDAVTALCQRYGIGRTTAVWRLDHTFGPGPSMRSQMLARSKLHGALGAHRPGVHRRVRSGRRATGRVITDPQQLRALQEVRVRPHFCVPAAARRSGCVRSWYGAFGSVFRPSAS